MDWTDEVIERLRALWTEGHSTAEIGRRMGVSKNAVVGKAHRLNLIARPSPIRRAEGGEAPRRASIRRSVGPTLPPFEAERQLPASVLPPPHVVAPAQAVPVQTTPVQVPLVQAGPVHVARPVAVPMARQPVPATPAPSLRSVGRSSGGGRIIPCCWPIGEPGTRSFRFCDVASAAGKPYCSEHAALAYVKIRDRREDAA